MPGKKMTRNKIKKQKIMLTNSMKALRKQFLSQNEDIKVFYAMFCKLRPFWIVDPKCESRDTCTYSCVQTLHLNFQDKINITF